MRKVKCWICGAEATSTRIIDRKDNINQPRQVSYYCRSYCEKCKEAVDRKEKEERELYIKLKKREMFKRACDILESQNTNMYAYKEAIEVVEEFVEENPDKFDSSYEVLAAIVLIQNRILVKTQYKIGPYQVDFLLPEMFVVLEIDGERHKYKKVHDTKRDMYIQKALGDGWDIIRIPTEHLDKNAKKLPDAIKKVVDYRQAGKVDWRKLYYEE